MLARLGVAFLFCLWTASLAAAASLSATTHTRDEANVRWDTVRVIFLTGEIRLGDELRLKSLLRGHEDENGWYGAYTLLALDSSGGDLNEALKIIRLIKERSIPTYVPAGAQCLSACAFVFMAGTQSWDVGNRFHGRFLDVGGKLGFHAPYPSTGDGRFTQGIGAIADIFAALGELDADLYFSMLTTPRDSFTYADTIGRIGGWNIQLAGYEPPVVTRESLFTACYNTYRWFDAAELPSSVLEAGQPKVTIEEMAEMHGNALVEQGAGFLRYYFEEMPFGLPHCQLSAVVDEERRRADGGEVWRIWYSDQAQQLNMDHAAQGTIGIPLWWLLDPGLPLGSIARDAGPDRFDFLRSSDDFGGVGP